MAYEPYVPMTAYYENTTQKSIHDTETNELLGYDIAPVAGYVLHDNTRDFEMPDFENNPDEMIFKQGYTRGSTSVPPNYDFEANPRGLYAIPESEVPADQIFGGGGNNNEHEVM